MTIERADIPPLDWENAAHAAARLAKQVELALDAVDLSLPQYRVMVFLSEGAAGASTLAGTLAVSRPTITVVVDGLVAKGYVERQGDETDRRKVHHRLTPTGRRALDRADAAVAARLADLAVHIDDQETRTAVRGLALWGKALLAARNAAASRT
ncbi:MAG TPA: MarR family winged helix-turn-helix transcriptional regulator [Acidimicrobiales bacterium]|nr:MarR family winged helix-turn-helix transcriptional regulator [Acidimicrobiales bacterium]